MVKANELLVFASKDMNRAFFEEGLEQIKQFGHVGFVCQPSSSALQIPKADRVLRRLEFAEYDSIVDTKKNELPDGFQFRTIDKELIEKMESREEIIGYCGSLENFLNHSFGICLVHNDEIISEAYAAFVAEKNVEISIATKEAQRGHGYASIASSYFMQVCLERGFNPYWSCDADNNASIRLARKLGFCNEREYDINLYRGTST